MKEIIYNHNYCDAQQQQLQIGDFVCLFNDVKRRLSKKPELKKKTKNIGQVVGFTNKMIKVKLYSNYIEDCIIDGIVHQGACNFDQDITVNITGRNLLYLSDNFIKRNFVPEFLDIKNYHERTKGGYIVNMFHRRPGTINTNYFRLIVQHLIKIKAHILNEQFFINVYNICPEALNFMPEEEQVYYKILAGSQNVGA